MCKSTKYLEMGWLQYYCHYYVAVLLLLVVPEREKMERGKRAGRGKKKKKVCARVRACVQCVCVRRSRIGWVPRMDHGS